MLKKILIALAALSVVGAVVTKLVNRESDETTV